MIDLYKFLVGNMSERNHLQDTGTDGEIKFKWIFGKWERDELE
jgi:hypothetical protein